MLRSVGPKRVWAQSLRWLERAVYIIRDAKLRKITPATRAASVARYILERHGKGKPHSDAEIASAPPGMQPLLKADNAAWDAFGRSLAGSSGGVQTPSGAQAPSTNAGSSSNQGKGGGAVGQGPEPPGTPRTKKSRKERRQDREEREAADPPCRPQRSPGRPCCVVSCNTRQTGQV